MELARARVLRHESVLGRWEMAFADPDPRLRTVVSGYQGFAMSPTGFRRWRELPSPSVPLIVNLGPPIRVTDPRAPGSPRDVGSFVAGLDDTYSLTEADGWMHGVEVRFTPLGAQGFAREPMSALSQRVVELEDVLGADARRLAERLHEAAGWDARFAILDEAIGARLAEGRDPPDGIEWAWRTLEETCGLIPIATLREELGWSAKRLIARFREHIGLPPKTVARLFRFTRALRLLDSGRHTRWADIAHDCGYADQAHLVREFHEFAGSPPSDFLRRRLPDAGGVVGD